MQISLENIIYKDHIIKIPKSIVKDLINDKHYRAFMVFLQLKPVYISSVILNDEGKIPYAKMAAYTGLSLSGLRGKVKQLKKHKLLMVDREKNVHLASYKTFVSLFKPQFLRRMKKYRYNNVASADILIRTAAIQESFRKQEYVLKHKIITKEIYGTDNAHVDRIKQPEGLNSFIAQHDCRMGSRGSGLSQTGLRKLRKIILRDYDNILNKHKRKYLEQLEQVVNGYPDINPYITLSCAGLGRLFGTGATSGHYHRRRLSNASVLKVSEGGNHKIHAISPDMQQEAAREGLNVFSYHYPVKRSRNGMEEKFFIRLPDNISVNLNFIYINAKN